MRQGQDYKYTQPARCVREARRVGAYVSWASPAVDFSVLGEVFIFFVFGWCVYHHFGGDVMAGGLEWGLDCLRSCLTVGRVSGVCFGKQEEREYMWMSKRGFSGGVWGTGVRVSTPLKGVCDHPAVTPYGGGGANAWCSEIWCILFHCKFNHHVDFFLQIIQPFVFSSKCWGPVEK